jgi:hypothetical protein
VLRARGRSNSCAWWECCWKRNAIHCSRHFMHLTPVDNPPRQSAVFLFSYFILSFKNSLFILLVSRVYLFSCIDYVSATTVAVLFSTNWSTHGLRSTFTL